jgi:diadenosine tetraphosphate (Ap4A) HIT family hydrolase
MECYLYLIRDFLVIESMASVSTWRAIISSLPDVLMFSKFPIDTRTVFHASDLSFAFTNLKPVIPGHVLVSPRRVVDRLTNMTDHEVEDLFRVARMVGQAILLAHPQADSLTLTVQDGPSAGQTVPHVHVHVMPRWSSDRFNSSHAGNDAVYAAINESERGAYSKPRMDEGSDAEMRTKDSMIEEGQSLRKIIEVLVQGNSN